MTPYIATILVLVLISRNPAWIRLNVPASLGKPFAPAQLRISLGEKVGMSCLLG